MREREAENADNQGRGRRGAGYLSPAPEPARGGCWPIPPRNAAAVTGQLG